MNAIAIALKQEMQNKKGESMNYIAAIVCVIALVLINIFGTESKDINTILSAAIMALIWGGVQRGQKDGADNTDKEKRPGRGR